MGTIHRIFFQPNPLKANCSIVQIFLRILFSLSNCVLVILVLIDEAALPSLFDKVLHNFLLDHVEAHHVQGEADEEVDHTAYQLVGRVIVVGQILAIPKANPCPGDVVTQAYRGESDETEVKSLQEAPFILTAPHLKDHSTKCEVKKEKAEYWQWRHPLNGRRSIFWDGGPWLSSTS